MGPIIFPAAEQASWKYSIRAQEVFWDGGRRAAGVRASMAREEATAAMGDDSVRRAEIEAMGAWLDAVVLGARRGVVEERLKALEDHRRVVADLFDQGIVARNEILRTEVALRGVDDQKAAAEDGEAVALRALARAIGLEEPTGLAVPSSLAPPPPLPWTLEEVRTRSLAGNSTLRALSARLDAERQLVSVEKADRWPVAAFQLFHNYEQNRYMLHENVTGVFVGLRWDLWDGGTRAARAREAELEAERTATEATDARRRLAVGVEKAWRDWHRALDEEETARRNIDAAVETLRILEDQYREGLVRTTDVLDAESVLAESRFAELARRADAWRAEGTLLAALGEDLAAFYGGGAANAPSGETKP